MGGLVLWGASGHALVVADAVRLQGLHRIAGFLDDVHPERAADVFCGATILGGREQLDALFARGVRQLIVAFGDCAARRTAGALARARGFELVTVVHPRAVIAPSARLGSGTFVAAGAVVNPDARIGDDVILNTAASVDHECVVEDGSHVGPGAHLAGRVRVGAGAWIGIGAVVSDSVAIGETTIIGAGAVVLGDIPAGVVAHGVPAKVVRAR